MAVVIVQVEEGAVMSLADVFSYTAFVHAVAGTAGGSAAMTVFYPLDALRTIIQVEGAKGDGTIGTIMRMLREEGTANRSLSFDVASLVRYPILPFPSPAKSPSLVSPFKY